MQLLSWICFSVSPSIYVSICLAPRPKIEAGLQAQEDCKSLRSNQSPKGISGQVKGHLRKGQQSRLRKSEQGDKWSFCLTAGKIGPRIRRDDEQTSTPESFTGLQGEGGAGSHQGRPDDSPTGRAFRRSR